MAHGPSQKPVFVFRAMLYPARVPSSLVRHLLYLREIGNRHMTRLTIRNCIIAILVVFLMIGRQFDAAAQEAVSTTSSSGTSTGPTSSSSSLESSSTLSPTATSSAPEAVTSSGTATPAVERASSSTGVFAPTPVKIYVTVSGGYDDNVSTSPTNKQSSAFSTANLTLDYTFGDPRLQMILNAGGGFTYYFSHLSNQD